MAIQRVDTKVATALSRRRKIFISSLVARVLIALIISMFIIMAFFVSGVASR